MIFLSIFNSTSHFPSSLIQAMELSLTFVGLCGIIFYLLMTAENKNYYQKQK